MSNELREALRAEAIKFADQCYETVMQVFQSQVASMFGSVQIRPSQLPPPPASAVRTAERVEDALVAIVETLKARPDGLRSEDLRKMLNLDKMTLIKAIQLGKESDQIVQNGDRRATTYSLPSNGAVAQAMGRVVKRRPS